MQIVTRLSMFKILVPKIGCNDFIRNKFLITDVKKTSKSFQGGFGLKGEKLWTSSKSCYFVEGAVYIEGGRHDFSLGLHARQSVGCPGIERIKDSGRSRLSQEEINEFFSKCWRKKCKNNQKYCSMDVIYFLRNMCQEKNNVYPLKTSWETGQSFLRTSTER